MAAERDLKPVAAVYVADDGRTSASSLLGGIVSDLQELVRKEIALARVETVEQLDKAKTAGIALASAGAVLAVGGLLLLMALGWGVSDLLNWPSWAGFGIVGGVLTLTGVILLSVARRRISSIHPVPEKTAATIKENVAWLKDRTTGK